MIANYGYQDGSGVYFITIDTGCCVECEGRWCLAACPQHLYVVAPDDYDDEVAAIAEAARRRLRERCARCKPVGGFDSLPCTAACTPGAISHSW